MRWAEGPVYFPDGGYVLVSDIPNNRIMKYDEKDGSFTVFAATRTARTATRATARAGWSPASIR
jgi:sugar lactone lactonase YvrE